MVMKNKKAWLRIIEAFIGVMLVMGILLILVSRQDAKNNSSDEIERFGNEILDFISRDEALMNDALANNTANINRTIEQMISRQLGFYTAICPYDSICPNANPDALQKYVYSTERLIPPNLTSSSPGTKLKIFIWAK